MKRKKLHEGLFDSIVSSIMTWALKKDIKNDPEFQKTLRTHASEISQLSKEIEDAIAYVEKKHGGQKADRY